MFTSLASVERLHGLLSLGLLFSTLVATPAIAVSWRLQDLNGSYDDLHSCGIRLTGSDVITISATGGGGGPVVGYVGVGHGSLGNQLNTGESLEIAFDTPAIGAWYEVSLALDTDLDGQFGLVLVEAFDAGNASLGMRLVSGDGVKYLADEYGSAPISRVVLTGLADRISLGEIGYQETGPLELDLLNAGQLNLAVSGPPVLCDAQFTASDEIRLNDPEQGSAAGVGVYRGAYDDLLDSAEQMQIEFPYPVDELVLDSLLFDEDGDARYGEAVLFAYDEFGASLGSTPLQRFSLLGGPLTQSLDVTATLGVGGISRIEIYSLGDARRLDGVRYAPEPTIGLAAPILMLGMIGRARRGGRTATA